MLTIGAAVVVPAARPAVSDQLSDAKAQAAQIEAEITQTDNQIGYEGQAYDQAEGKVSQLNGQIQQTQAKIDADQVQVDHDQKVLRTAAINAYINEGQTGASVFDANQQDIDAEQVYTDVAEGNVSGDVDNLHTAQSSLDAQKSQLQSQQQQATQQADQAAAAKQQAQSLVAQQQSALASANAQVNQLIQQEQEQAAAAAAAAAKAKIAQQQAAQAAAAQAATHAPSGGGATGNTGNTGSGGTPPGTSTSPPPPPPAAGGAGAVAVAAAESQLGVPYVWGGETPGVGFDCSGLTAWSWGQAGVPLPHYSGAQYEDSTPVSAADMEPGDLLFYGPGGDEHVAMFIGGSSMIEAPYTGAVVWITSIRLGDGYVGSGRP